MALPLQKGFVILVVTRINITKEVNQAYTGCVACYMPLYQCHFLCLKIYF